jgi:hypothetical protein
VHVEFRAKLIKPSPFLASTDDKVGLSVYRAAISIGHNIVVALQLNMTIKIWPTSAPCTQFVT